MMNTAEPSGEPDPSLNLVQLEILRTIRRITQDRGRPPSMREVARALGRTSVGGLSHQYAILEAKGYLRRDVGCPRTVRVRLPGEPGFPSEAGEPKHTPTDTSQQQVVDVPWLARVAAGNPILAQELIEDVFTLPRQVVGAGTLFILKVLGDSMTGAGIVDGDWVVVRQQPDALNGDIVAATINGVEIEGTVKTYREIDGQPWLMPQNPAHTPIPGNRARIAGKVVAVLRRV
jgi:repressor LexA